MEDYRKCALWKEPVIAPSVECFKTALWESLTDAFCQYLEQNSK